MCKPLNRAVAIPEFQMRIMNAETKEEMLDASMGFIALHGGFSDSPEAWHKFEDSTKAVQSSSS